VAHRRCKLGEECSLHQEGAGRLPVPWRVPGLLQANISVLVLCQLGSWGIPGVRFPRQTAERTFSFKVLHLSLLALKWLYPRLKRKRWIVLCLCPWGIRSWKPLCYLHQKGCRERESRFALAVCKGGIWFERQAFCKRALPSSEQFNKGIFPLGLHCFFVLPCVPF